MMVTSKLLGTVHGKENRGKAKKMKRKNKQEN